MVIIKLYNSGSSEIIYSSGIQKDFDTGLLNLEKLYTFKLGQSDVLLNDNLTATVVNITDEYRTILVDVNISSLVQSSVITRNVVHSLNNIITTINNNIYLVKGMVSEDEGDDVLSTIDNASRTAVELTRSYLKYSIGSRTENDIHVDMRELLEDCINLVSFRLVKNRIKINFEYGESLPFYYGKKGMLQHTLISLITNAIEAFDNLKDDRERFINITLVYLGYAFMIKIVDNGVGISSDNISRLFESGFTTKPDGNGVGLYFTKNIIDKLGGDIEIKSELNKETEVILTLPNK